MKKLVKAFIFTVTIYSAYPLNAAQPPSYVKTTADRSHKAALLRQGFQPSQGYGGQVGAQAAGTAQMNTQELKHTLLANEHANSKSQPTQTTKSQIDWAANQKMKCWDPLFNSKPGKEPFIVSALLKINADINQQNANGATPLIKAATLKNTAAIATLLMHGANPNIQDKDGMTALAHAAKQKHTKSLEALLTSLDTDVNIANNKGETVRSIVRQKYIFPGALLRKFDAHTAKQAVMRRNNTANVPITENKYMERKLDDEELWFEEVARCKQNRLNAQI